MVRILFTALVGAVLFVTASAAERKSWIAPIDPSGRGAMATKPVPSLEPVRLIVRFRNGAPGMTHAAMTKRAEALPMRMEQLRRDLDRLDRGVKTADALRDGPRVIHEYTRVFFGTSVSVRPELRAEIARLPYVASVHEDPVMLPLLARSVPHIRADKVWSQHGTRGAGMTVAIIDSGIDYTHPALGGGIGSGFKVTGGWDFVDGDDDPMDTYGHGTHVAGIIAANGGGLVGVAPDVSLIAYRALAGSRGNGSDVLAAIERTVDPNQDGDPADHVDVVNISLGGRAADDDPLAAAVESATAAGVLFCIAAGNGGDYGNIETPGVAPSAITVGATGWTDAVAEFSSRGPSFTYGLKPEVVAPGVGIVSSFTGGRTVAAEGTSMATPHVAGVAALVKAVHRQWTPAEVKSAIVSTSVPLAEDVMAAGAGRIDALAATSVETLVSSPLVDFGRIDVRRAVWSSSKTVVLRNVTPAPQTLTAAVHGAREGVVVQVQPPAVTLAPGEATNVTVAIAVTNAAVPAPREGSLSFGGRVEWTGGTVPVHVPWTFVKGTFIHVDMPHVLNPGVISVLGDEIRKDVLFFFASARILWPLETVDVAALELGTPSLGIPNRVVVAERVDLTGDGHVPLQMSSARHTIATEVADHRWRTAFPRTRR